MIKCIHEFKSVDDYIKHQIENETDNESWKAIYKKDSKELEPKSENVIFASDKANHFFRSFIEDYYKNQVAENK